MAFHACGHFISILLASSVWSFAKELSHASQIAMLRVEFAACFVIAVIVSAGIDGLLILSHWIFFGLAGLLMVWGL
jgi:hypothetical protein